MAFTDTQNAIGRVSKLLMDQVGTMSGLTVTVGRPGPDTNGSENRLNLFLYEALLEPNLRNTSLDEGQPAPIWLVLKYLLTAFDDTGNSDSYFAHENLGKGIRVLQELSFLTLNAEASDALGENPEPLKITFDDTPSDLLSKLMQGTDENYRFSFGFQVRPVMITFEQPPSYSLLVGIDYTEVPPKPREDESVFIPVVPSMGPTISEIRPSKFEVSTSITIIGNDLHITGLTVTLGGEELVPTSQETNKLEFFVNSTIEAGTSISAGSHLICVSQLLPTGRKRPSNTLVGNLLPKLGSASFNPDPGPVSFGNIVMTGALLGTGEDDIFVALYKDGKVLKMFDHEFIVVPDQKQLTLKIATSEAVSNGEYRLILRVNGQQAKNSPAVNIP